MLSSDAVTRDLPGRVIDRTVDGIDANPAGANYTYDGAGRLTDWWETDPSTSTQYHGTYNFGTTPTECAGGSWGNATNAGRNSNRATSTLAINGGAAATTKYCYDFADRIQKVITESHWVAWRLLTLETRMESCQQNEHRGSRRRVGTAPRRRNGRCVWSVSSAPSWAPITGR